MPANAKRPNLVLIMTDEMRGDCLGAAGHPDVKTPFLDTLAAQGIRFSRAYSTCPSCIAARAALHTGLSQEHHGRVGYRDGVPWDYPVTMAGELAKAGYATACAGKMHVYPLRRSMGFHHIDLHDGYLHAHRKPNIPHHEHQMVADDYLYWLKNEKGIACDITDTGLECNSWVTRPWMYDEHLHPTNWATGRALDFLRRRDRDQPFFLMLSYVRPHAPYDPPACYYDMYKNKALAPPFSGDWDDLERLRREGRVFCNTTGPLDPELIRQQQAGYYACITHVDHQIGRFLQGLMDEELYDNTVVVFTSDHGELLSDHGLCRKSRPYEGSAHIPLLLWGPEAVIGRGGGSAIAWLNSGISCPLCWTPRASRFPPPWTAKACSSLVRAAPSFMGSTPLARIPLIGLSLPGINTSGSARQERSSILTCRPIRRNGTTPWTTFPAGNGWRNCAPG